MSLCNEQLRELSNPGASGSVFYLTNDDEFIIKTVQSKEATFLRHLLPGYYMVSTAEDYPSPSKSKSPTHVFQHFAYDRRHLQLK